MKQCLVCGREFIPSSRHLKCPACREKEYKAKYNNQCVCGRLIQQGSFQCITCHNKDLIGRFPSPYRYVSSQGYVYVREKGHPRAASNNGLVFEHIIVMEKRIGRYLLPKENVHHKNGIKTDNRDENLELWVRNQPVGTRVSDLIVFAKEILQKYGFEEEKYI